MDTNPSSSHPESSLLSGRTILVTRPRMQAGPLAEGLRALGARVIVLPALEITPPEDAGPLDRALADPKSYSLVIFTSANAVEGVIARLTSLGGGPASLRDIPLVAIGQATSDKLRDHFLAASLIPAKGTSEGVLEALAETPVTGIKVLIPGAAEGRRVIAEGLRKRGAEVIEVEAYRTIQPSPAEPAIRKALDELGKGPVDLVVFASPSAVRNLTEMLESGLRERVQTAPAAVIGPVTAQAARNEGYTVVAEPAGQTVEGVISSIKEVFRNKK